MTVGVVGLGLIGGSIAKAYKANSDFKVLGADSDSVIVEFAKMAQAIDEELGEENLKSCDVIYGNTARRSGRLLEAQREKYFRKRSS
ncbi:MAG: hypothetical protein ACLVKR_04605 [Lachnospiraceae bacterium]